MSERATAVAAWEALFRAQVSVMRELGAEFPSNIMSLNEYDVLFTLSRMPGRRLRLRELNREMLLTQPSVSRLVDRLAARDLVAKLHDPDDARGVIVELSDKGFDLFRRAAVNHVRSINERVGSVLDQHEMETLIHLCDKLRLASNTADE